MSDSQDTAAPRFIARKGLKPGKHHVDKEINCQDFVDQRVVTSPSGVTYTIGFLSDGCSGENPKMSHSEVIAKLLVTKALVETRLLLLSGTPLEELNVPLFQRCVSFIQSLAHMIYPGLTGEEEYVKWVGNTLMATLLGYVTDGKTKLVSLRSGDGVRIHNGQVLIVHDKCPNYLGYHALSPAQLQSIVRKAPEGFTLDQAFQCEVFAIETLDEFGLTTDGICQGPPDAEFVSPEDAHGIFENDLALPAGLQWYLNIRANTTPFKDDMAALTFKRLPTGKVS